MGSKKVVKQRETVYNNKKPISIEDPEAYLKKRPVWAFKQCDLGNEKWSIKNNDSFFDNILFKLISYEGMTWGEIQSASGGKSAGNGTNNHFEYIAEMSKEAQKRAKELHLDVDQLFSLRLTGKERLYGILNNGVFYVLWYDSEHEIYPSARR